MRLDRNSLESVAKKAVAKAMGALPDKAATALAGDPYEIDDYTLDQRLQLAMKAAAGNESIASMPTSNARESSREGFALSNAPRVDGISVSPTIITDPVHGDLDARVYTPDHALDGLRPAVLFLHQGGLIIGDLDTCDTFCTQMAAGLDAIVVSLDYQLAPEHPFPTQNDNVDAAWAWMLDSAPHLGIDRDQIVVCGDSAGGQLAASLCQRLRDAGQPNPAAQVLIYPFVNAEADSGSMQSCADAWPLTLEIAKFFMSNLDTEGFDRSDPSFSPALHPDLSGLAPAVVVTAAFDILRDQGRRYARQLTYAGVPVIERCETEMPHSFISMGALSPAAYEASERIVADIATMLAERHLR